MRAIRADSRFLEQRSIMDYSLLLICEEVSVEEVKRE